MSELSPEVEGAFRRFATGEYTAKDLELLIKAVEAEAPKPEPIMRKQVHLVLSVDDDRVAYLNDKRIAQMDWELSVEENIEIVTEELADLLGERVRMR
jgi:hypothetical protein